MQKNRFLDSLSNALPDDRPITCLQLVELADKCPKGFSAITKTFDHDQDADLWREGTSFLKKKSVRYLCTSKSEGLPDFVVQELIILNEKVSPPLGYSLINKTADTDQKAWRKKQLCYKLAKKRFIKEAITDIIICKSKAPQGFSLVGEINGVSIYYKMGNVNETQSESPSNGNSVVPAPPERPPRHSGSVYPNLNGSGGGVAPSPVTSTADGDYEILSPWGRQPSRPAPRPPTGPPLQHQHSGGGHNTLSGTYSGLEGVPFILNPKFMFSAKQSQFQIPTIKTKTRQQILTEYDYPFTVERQT